MSKWWNFSYPWLRQWGSWRCPIIGYHQPYLLQNRNPTHVHLWPGVRALNIHQKCIKFADCHSFPTACQAPNLFLLRGIPIALNCQWTLLILTALKEVTTLDLFSVWRWVCVCVCACVHATGRCTSVFSYTVWGPSVWAEPFQIACNLLEPHIVTLVLLKHWSDLWSTVTSHRKCCWHKVKALFPLFLFPKEYPCWILHPADPKSYLSINCCGVCLFQILDKRDFHTELNQDSFKCKKWVPWFFAWFSHSIVERQRLYLTLS